MRIINHLYENLICYHVGYIIKSNENKETIKYSILTCCYNITNSRHTYVCFCLILNNANKNKIHGVKHYVLRLMIKSKLVFTKYTNAADTKFHKL